MATKSIERTVACQLYLEKIIDWYAKVKTATLKGFFNVETKHALVLAMQFIKYIINISKCLVDYELLYYYINYLNITFLKCPELQINCF